MADPNQARPRPRPKPVAKKTSNAIPTSTLGASFSSGGLISSPTKRRAIEVEDTDEMFMRNRNRTSKTWQRLAEINKEVPKTGGIGSDSENEMSPRSKNKKKKHELSVSLWQKDQVLARRMLSEAVSDDSDSDLELIGTSLTPNGKQNRKRRRQQRSRSRSITPPPALPLHQIQNAKNIVRQALAPVRRTASPTHIDLDESADAIVLQPELKAIAKEIAENSHTHLMSDKEVPTAGVDHVILTVKWQPHPMDQNGKAEEWQYKIDRSDNFRELFEATADDATIMAENLVMTYRDKRFFPSVTPHTLKIWTETAELVACTKATYEYIRAHPHSIINTSFGSSNAGKAPIDSNDEAGAPAGASFLPESQQSDAESESDEDKFKLILRSALTTNKEISLVVRPTTKCGAIVKAFLKKAGLAGQYPEVFAVTPASAAKKGGKKSKGGSGGKDPKLCLDGDKLDNTSEIGDAGLEDGDMIEVVGL